MSTLQSSTDAFAVNLSIRRCAGKIARCIYAIFIYGAQRRTAVDSTEKEKEKEGEREREIKTSRFYEQEIRDGETLEFNFLFSLVLTM